MGVLVLVHVLVVVLLLVPTRSPSDRAHFHVIAHGSAMECGALVDVVRILGLANESEAREAKDLVVRIVSMLSKMCR